MDPPLPPEPVAEMLDGVGEVNITARDAGALQATIEHPSRGADERMTLDVLAITRSLADEHQLRAPRALAHHRLRGGLPQVAGAAGLDVVAERCQRRALGYGGGWEIERVQPNQPLPGR